MVDASRWPITIIESPYAQRSPKESVNQNVAYLKRAIDDCISRSEVPFASHGFFPFFLNDGVAGERETGITMGYAMWAAATKIAFYIDRGWSPGMNNALEKAKLSGHTIEYRVLDEENKTE